jgi:hypothetical protein
MFAWTKTACAVLMALSQHIDYHWAAMDWL